MKSNIEVHVNGVQYPVAYWYFPAGEIATSLVTACVDSLKDDPWGSILVYAQIRDPVGLIATRQVINNIKEVDDKIHIILALPYFPHSRQDKVFNTGESEARTMVSQLFHGIHILTADMHSPYNKVEEICQKEILMRLFCKLALKESLKDTVILSTDKGELPKLKQFLKECPWDLELIEGSKIRDPTTRKLSSFKIHGDCHGKTVWTVDDIIDSGNTNCGIADVVLSQGPRQLNAFATHGIFSKGFGELDKRFHRIICTDTILDMDYLSKLPYKDKPLDLKIIRIKELFTNSVV